MAAFITFQPSDFFNNILYTGTGSSNAITGVGFQPDFTWIKNRDAADNHMLFNSPSGVTKYLHCNLATAETTQTESLKTFDSDGFTVGTYGDVNTNTEDYVCWNWKGGTTSGIATNGSTTITPSAYSFSQTAGFSVIKYTGNATAGAKLAHGLGKAPTLIWVKNLDDGNDWKDYQKYVKGTDPEDWVMILNTSAATVDDNTVWNDTQPDDVNITLGSSTHVNDSSTAYVAYCFAPIQGQQIFGRYYGNANVDGPFIQTNFRPKFIVLKRLDGTTDWKIVTNPPYTFNDADTPMLTVNNADVESSAYAEVEFISNGFKIRDSNSVINTNGSQNIYWAFSEFPFVSSNSKAGTAR